VAETNEQQGILARAQDNMRDEIRELRIRGAKAQSDILELREENTKLRFELEDREEQLKSAAIEKAQEERRVSEVIRKLEQEIGQFQGDVTAMVAAITSEKEEAVKEQGMKLENLSKSLTAEIDKRMK
jgi:regulator of replication initiation timing